VGDLKRFGAIELFVDRASAVSPSFVFSSGNALTIASLCRRLDGIPLAIELAAARVDVLSVEQISQRLDNRFALLTKGARSATSRQRTLRGAIDWSYELLTEAERLLLRRLSVFAGGWTIDAVESVCAYDGIEPWETLDILDSLIDKSLVQASVNDASTRYRFLESLREYAWERLAGTPDESILVQRHFAHYRDFVRAAEPELTGSDQILWLERLDVEFANIKSAFNVAAAGKQKPGDSAVELAGRLWRYWYARGLRSEGRAMLESGLASEPHAPLADRRRALLGAAILAFEQCDQTAATTYGEAALQIARRIADDAAIAQVINALGVFAMSAGDYVRAKELLGETIAICQRRGDDRSVAVAQANIGKLEIDLGNIETARRLIAESLRTYRELGDVAGINEALNASANAAWSGGDFALAREHALESIDISGRLGDVTAEAYALTNLAQAMILDGFERSSDELRAAARTYLTDVLARCRDLDDKKVVAFGLELSAQMACESDAIGALTLLSAATAFRKSICSPVLHEDRRKLGELIERLRGELGEAAAGAAWAAGEKLSIEEALARAKSLPHTN
jgi:non-specific serine/threonine protein kinase